MKSVVLTRCLEDNLDIIRTLRQLNFNDDFSYIFCPLIEYKDLRLKYNILQNYSNIIVTSKYAARIISSWFVKNKEFNITSIIKKNAWVVGVSSEKALQQSNLIIQYVAKNVQDLIKNIPQDLYSQTIYLSSNEITQDLPKEIKRQIIYEVNYASELSQIELLKKGVDYILLYSQNCARTLVQLLIKDNLLKLVTNTIVIAISLKVADIIRPFVKNVIYCDNETSEQMLELLIYDAKIRN